MLDGLVAGEETAASLGIEVGHLRRVLVVTTALMTGAFVAMSGPIGFIGLMVPHAARSVVGVGHRRVLILSALVGAVIAVWADLAARVLFAPEELPIGVITATCGGPAFLLLVLRSSRARWTSRS
jgi:iron complex transport system permease protein